MPTTSITTRISNLPPSGAGERVVLSCPTVTFAAPLTNPKVRVSRFNQRVWTEIPRMGDYPLVRSGAYQLSKLSLEITLAEMNGLTAEEQLGFIRRLGSQLEPVSLGYGKFESSKKWYITDVSYEVMERHEDKTVRHATVQLELTEYVANDITVPSAVAKPATPAPGAKKRTVKYTVKSGDTLTGIALKITGSSANYKRIAAENKIAPSPLKTGTILVVNW